MARERRRASRRERAKDTVETISTIGKVNQPKINISPYEMVSEEGIEKIHQASLEILSDTE